MPDEDTIAGVLLGTALGDALGLPHEGLSPQRIARRLHGAGLRHAMWRGRGLLSDDTEHTAMVARALATSGGDVDGFRDTLAAQLRRWLLGLPPGIGLATLRSCTRLLLGWSPARSGVHSAGNGPAMRSALLGIAATDDVHLQSLVQACTRISHTDPRAEDGALVVARYARALARGTSTDGIVRTIRDDTFRAHTQRAWDAPADLEAFRRAAGFERGVSGFIVHTVPAAVYCVRTGSSVEDALERAVRLGGDTDTVAAIVGALVGAQAGASGLPRAWLDGIVDWPLSTDALRELGRAVANGTSPRPRRWLAALPRNLATTALILGHIGLRLLGR